MRTPKATPDRRRPDGFEESLSSTVLNALSAHIAILDEQGVILETNRAWQTFAAGKTSRARSFAGVNYLSVCEAAQGEGADDASAAAEGIRAVISGRMREFLHAYPCHSPTEPHWFYMRAVRMQFGGAIRVVVSHEEVTRLKLAEEALQESKAVLEEQKKTLEEANIALKVLLRHREKDKAELEQTLLANIQEMVLPYLERLKRAHLGKKEKTLLEIMEKHLSTLLSPLLQRMANIHVILTPQELQVAAMVRDGKSSKEIAEILGLSEATIHFHRKNLRRKFGLDQRGANLRTYLISMS